MSVRSKFMRERSLKICVRAHSVEGTLVLSLFTADIIGKTAELPQPAFILILLRRFLSGFGLEDKPSGLRHRRNMRAVLLRFHSGFGQEIFPKHVNNFHRRGVKRDASSLNLTSALVFVKLF